MNCWLNIYKPPGISSAKAVSIIKRILNKPKIGHCGTLDLEAEGVLPLAIGEATKLVQFLINAKKTYVFTIKFGAKTDSADFTGKTIAITGNIPSKEECYKICKNFIGVQEQIPPAFSAIKVNGVRSYKLARQNNAKVLNSRKIEIFNLEMLEFDEANQTATFLTTCSKGTYIRTLAEDIALSLQSLGFVIKLRRTQVGMFIEDNAVNISQLDHTPQEFACQLLEEKSLRIETVLDDIPVIDATIEQFTKIKHGQKCYFDLKSDINSLWVRYQGVLIAIGSVNNNCFNSLRVFNLI